MSSMIGSMTPQREQLLALSFLFLLPSAEIKASAQLVGKISRLNHHVTLLARCLRLSDAVTGIIPRLATGGWLTLARLASHQLDYSPFVWAHNSDLLISLSSIIQNPHPVRNTQFKSANHNHRLSRWFVHAL